MKKVLLSIAILGLSITSSTAQWNPPGAGLSTPITRSGPVEITAPTGYGIGLKVMGRIKTADGVINNGGVFVDNSESMFMGDAGNISLGFWNGGAWRLIVNKSGNVGIGTLSPAGLLHLNSANPEIYLTATNSSTPTGAIRGVNGSWLFGYSGAAGSEEIAMGTGDGTGSRTLGFYTGGSVKMKMLANGYLGLGTTAPQSLLHLTTGADRQQITLSSAGNTGVYSDVVFDPISPGNLASESGKQWLISHRKDGYFTGGSINNGSSLEYYSIKVGGGYYCPLAFKSNGDVILASNSNATSGNVAIGTTKVDAGYKLSVNGSIKAQGVKVTSLGWADYVFLNQYKLKPLLELETYIKENKHLPEVPSAAEVEKEGINLGEMDAILLKKIEELTLYMINQKKELDLIKTENEILKNKNIELETRIGKIEN